VQQRARQLGLVGTVRNLPDASVEVMAAGAPEKLVELEAALRRGPPHADVQQLRSIEPSAGLNQAGSFDITG
jgi:acylphosphatase